MDTVPQASPAAQARPAPPTLQAPQAAPGAVRAAPRVSSGAITALRLFDIANAIDLVRAQTLWLAQARQGARTRLTGTPPKAVSFGDPPLGLVLPPVTLTLAGRQVDAQVTARLYVFGVVTLAVRVPADGCGWTDFTALVNAVDAAIGPQAATTLWQDTLDRLRDAIRPALDRPMAALLEEDYLVATVHAFEAPVAASALGTEIDLVPLLSGEQRTLADGARADLLSRRFSYYTDDLVVLTWDRAFIYEPRRDTDVADVIEVANAQLLEMRYYDELLDDELPRMYDLVEETRRLILAPRRFARLARRLYGLVAEVTELTEKVDNALQVTEDVYLARVYASALDLFRVKLVSAAVDRKLAIIRDTYAALYDESASARAGLMEAAVVGLIVVEIVLALRPMH
jgi:hypothetical protein